MRDNDPVGPSSPWFFQLGQLIVDPIGFLTDCGRRYGDRFALRLLGPKSPPLVFLSDPDEVGAVWGTLAASLEFGKVTQVFLPLVGSQSLIMQQGDRHQRQRQLLMPAFHRESLLRQGELICQLTQAQMRGWKVGQKINIRQEMSQISLRVILEVVFGLVPGERYEALRSRLEKLLDQITDPLYSVQFFLPPLQKNWGTWSPWGRFQVQMAEIDSLIYAEMNDRRSQPVNGLETPLEKRGDILSMLMLARDADGEAMPDVELRDQLMTLLLLGHETTASSLSWAFYWVHRDPMVLARLRSEIEPVRSQPIVLSEQPYLTAVCKESLRLQPIALIAQPRRVKETVVWNDRTYAEGTVLIPCILTAHQRSATYQEPDRFNPDRFIERKFSPSEFFPFGGGSRSCVGMALSLFEMKLVLATVLDTFEFESNLMDDVKADRRGITFVPPEVFRLTAKSSLRLPL
jgi:cytochrome P450 family 110